MFQILQVKKMKNIFKWCLSQLLYVLQWHLKIFHFILLVLNLQHFVLLLYWYSNFSECGVDQFSRLHTFERPCFVCTSAKNNKLVVSFSYRILKMPSYMARKTTPQARKVAVCQARLPGPWCGRWCPLSTLARAVLALSAALHWRSPPRYASARLCTATVLYIGLRMRSMQAPALFPSLRSSPPCFARALPYAMPALGHAKAARARSSPLAFDTACGGAARWGASWWGGLRCPLPQSNYCLV